MIWLYTYMHSFLKYSFPIWFIIGFFFFGGGVVVAKSCPTLVAPWTVAARLLCPWDSPGKKLQSGLPSPPQRDLPDPGIEATPLTSPAFIGRQILYHQHTWEAPKYFPRKLTQSTDLFKVYIAYKLYFPLLLMAWQDLHYPLTSHIYFSFLFIDEQWTHHCFHFNFTLFISWNNRIESQKGT